MKNARKSRAALIKELTVAKNSLRDELFDMKSYVRRSFGTLSSEVTELEEQIVTYCANYTEEAILKRILGNDTGTQRQSVAAVFKAIDAMHSAMEHAGVRRRRSSQFSSAVVPKMPTQQVSPGCAAEQVEHLEAEELQSCEQPLMQQCTSVITTVESPEGEEPLTVPAMSQLQATLSDDDHKVTFLDQHSDHERDDGDVDGRLAMESTLLTAGSRSRLRSQSFSHGDLFSVTSFALQESSQMRLDTLACLRNEILESALLAQRKLVAAKRWVPDAPNPLAASVEGLINEVAAMKRQLLEDAPSVTVASLPMVQFPLPSMNVKQMKQQQLKLSPRRCQSPIRSPTQNSALLPPVAFLKAQRTGTLLVEGPSAVEDNSRRRLADTALAHKRLRRLLCGGETTVLPEELVERTAQTPPPPKHAAELGEALSPDVAIIRQREHTRFDDIQKILKSVKYEIQNLGKPGFNSPQHGSPLSKGSQARLPSRPASDVLDALTASLAERSQPLIGGAAPSFLARAVTPMQCFSSPGKGVSKQPTCLS